MPKTSFRSYLSSTVGVLGFTTSSAFLLSGFFFPPKSGMMTLVVFAFLRFLFICLSCRPDKVSQAQSAHRPSREFTERAQPPLAAAAAWTGVLVLAWSLDPTLSRDFLSLPAAASAPSLYLYLNPLLPWQTACQTL